ncbi:hypothetical protein EC912_10146 [Luteibacter rhizovicinus]|uniref:Uncharacterized protein n=1 Tax=Luteibacter rhizovicinus TaxID=242606 RepID=A0A4R3YWZ1_9GAMM|nr:hypothetical protein [Luteibacter rhizovicinus]TCV97052.1 hypothetical protein EC912_10146 [Luteibacter rhizovicinus]
MIDDTRQRVLASLRLVDEALASTDVVAVIVIGSAAACVAGADVDVADIDLLTSSDVAGELEHRWTDRRVASYAPADGHLFRSRFARYAFSDMPVEVMGGLEVAIDGQWRAVDVRDTLPVSGLRRVRVASVDDQQRLLALFGRPKDVLRAQALRMTGAGRLAGHS